MLLSLTVVALLACKSDKAPAAECTELVELIESECSHRAQEDTPQDKLCQELQVDTAAFERQESPDAVHCEARHQHYLSNRCVDECSGSSSCSKDGLAVVACFDLNKDGCLQRLRQECGTVCKEAICDLEFKQSEHEEEGIYAVTSRWGMLTPGKTIEDGYAEFGPDKILLADSTGLVIFVSQWRESLYGMKVDGTLTAGNLKYTSSAGTPPVLHRAGDGYVSWLAYFQTETYDKQDVKLVIDVSRFDRHGKKQETKVSWDELRIQKTASCIITHI